jgi:Uma2 family endonuclease
MATVEQPIAQCMLLENVSWETYERLLEEIGERPIHLTYDRGSLEFMTLSLGHEGYSCLLARFVDVLTEELNLPMKSRGSVTMKREDLKRGLESDHCFWIANEALMRGKHKYDPYSDPPPDLALEIDVSRSSIPRMPIYASLGIPEVWRHHADSLDVYALTSGGEYKRRKRSLAFPFLPFAELMQFLKDSETQDETSLIRSFRKWVRELIVAQQAKNHRAAPSPKKKG